MPEQDSLSEVEEVIKNVCGMECVESYREMLNKWARGEVMWEDIETMEGDEESIIAHTWTMVKREEEVDTRYKLLHSTPSHKPGENPHETPKRYRSPSVDASVLGDAEEFATEVAEAITLRER